MQAIIIFLSIICRLCYCQDVSSATDIKTLSELPLNKLLEVRETFDIDENQSPDQVATDRASLGPEALALQGKLGSNNRGSHGGHYEEHHVDYDGDHYKKGSKKGIQSIFQLSVTTLAFLAFGGYLLCLIVQAIKGKEQDSMNTMSNNMQMMAAMLRRSTQRPVRLQRPRTRRPTTKLKRPRREAGIWPNIDQDNMYYSLVTLSEAYTNYHTVDYQKYNFTSQYNH